MEFIFNKIGMRSFITGLLFLFFFIWWIILQIGNHHGDYLSDLFTYTYGFIALIGGIIGYTTSYKVVGPKSLLGRSLVLFSAGLLFQGLGQATYTFYSVVFNIAIPYPSVGDIFYFGSIPLYIYGVWILSKAIGVKYSLKNMHDKLVALSIPLILLLISYFIFLPDYDFEDQNILVVFLDFGYPLGQAIFISLAIVAYTFSIKILGGIMKVPTLLLFFALVIQYLADFTYSYQVYHETWMPGGINDFTYVLAYFLMSLSLITFSSSLDKLNKPNGQVPTSN